MGGAASVNNLDELSAEQVGDLVGKLGPAYEPYGQQFISDRISGEIIASQTEVEVQQFAKDLGITNPVHQKVLLSHFTKLKGRGASASAPAGGGNDPDCCQYHALPSDFQVGEKVTRTPRDIMSKLFEIQGIAVDPTDLDPAVDKIVRAVGTGFGDGKERYDCFINYRVATDADLAEKLFLYLKTKGIHAFLDKKCLKNGEKWKDGFLTGLKNSKCFVALISRRALDRVRDEGDNHTLDNVLLEYETALAIKLSTSNPKYVCPLHIGSCEKGVLSKFIDFAPSLYPDTLEAVKKEGGPAPAAPAAAPVARGRAPPSSSAPFSGDAGGNYGTHCGMCESAVSRMPDGSLPEGAQWSCNYPGHEGDNCFTSDEPVYGCPTAFECGWTVCETCFTSIQHSTATIATEEGDENELKVDQPEGTRSKYNDEYYCDLRRITFRGDDDGWIMVVTFNVRGDGSLGGLQDPSTSRIIVGGHTIHSSETKIFIQDFYQIQGDLYFKVPNELQTEFTTDRVAFAFGNEGFSEVDVAIPGSEYINVHFPRCTNGHVMTISDYGENGYENGYSCNTCREGKPLGFRWFCSDCHDDYCFACQPCQVMNPKCQNDHAMERRTTRPTGYSSVSCDECARGALQHDAEFYHCKDGCNYDLCLKCASEQVAATVEA